MGSSHLFKLADQVFWALGISVVYGALGAAVVVWLEPAVLADYVKAFAVSFNCIISGGLIIGTAMFVFTSQRDVPAFIEESFDADSLARTAYAKKKAIYLNRGRSMRFATYFTIAAFFIFYLCRFPVPGAAEYILIGFACVEYALGIYVGRKLYYIAQMLDAVRDIEITRDIFKLDALGSVVSYVNVLSTMTTLFVYVHVKSYYGGPFLYPFGFKEPLQLLLLLPVVVATPVIVVFNFYPRSVLRKLYSRSIKQELDRLMDQLRRQNLSEYERLSYVVEYDALQRDELKTRLQLSLSDVPIGLTLVLMVVALFIKP
ncbi:MAG: hypothetical protein JST16_08955 [Bdellovibrionales bacterium]|nr:hypothetical protein [Bdellovibrionales bacterium]